MMSQRGEVICTNFIRAKNDPRLVYPPAQEKLNAVIRNIVAIRKVIVAKEYSNSAQQAN